MLIHPHIHHRRAGRRFASGLTLIELLVVLMVLIAVAGIVIPNVTESRNFAQQTVTEQTLMRVRAAIMGDERVPGLWRDLGGHELDPPLSISDLFVRRVEWPRFDPNTRLGWHGPYIQPTGVSIDEELASEGYGNVDDPAILDGWGRPIVIQDAGTLQIRLVSGGADRLLNTADDNIQLSLLPN
jgi:type II secretory pathway pseudopilin PulG